LLPPITELTEVDEDSKPAARTSRDGNLKGQTGDKDEQVAIQLLASEVPPATEQTEKTVTTFTFRAQLTWGLPFGTRVNLPQLFREWIKTTSTLIPEFALLPFDDEKGQAIVSAAQVPDDNASFYQDYYHNHRVLNHGNMTGMVHFRCTMSWNKIKRMKDPYFQWLHKNKIYLNLAKFKSATLVVCGFLVGAHPGHLRREDAEVELRNRLQLSAEFPFQLSSRTISVPRDSSKNPERFSFQAVAVETSTNHAKQLREAFFSQPKPVESAKYFPYTGPYQFVPMLQSKEWPVWKIFQLAKVHVKLCGNLEVIYVQNLQDIRNSIGHQGQTLMRGFIGLTVTVDGKTLPLIHSIHNTGRLHVKAVLVHHEQYEYALEQLSVIHQALLSGVPQEFYKKVFVDNLEAGLTDSHRDTIQSCNSSLNANELLQLYNPQDAEGEPSTTNQKRFKPSVISYAAAAGSSDTTTHTLESSYIASKAASNQTPTQTHTQQATTISSLTDQDLDQLYERLKHHVDIVDDQSPGVTAEEMERIVNESNQNIMQVREEMRTSVTDLKEEITNISNSVKKQNAVVVMLQKTLEATSTDLKTSVNQQVADLSSQIQGLRTLVISLLPPTALQAAAQSGRQSPS
jgi:hypothetical protein